MIDQLVSGLPQAQQVARESHRGRQGSPDDRDAPADTFEDLVAGKAAQRQLRDDAARTPPANLPPVTLPDDAGLAEVAVEPGIAEPLPAEDMPGPAISFDALPEPGPDSTEGVRYLAREPGMPAVLDARRKAPVPAEAGDERPAEDAALARFIQKASDASVQVQASQPAAVDTRKDALSPLSPADELGLLLGMHTGGKTQSGQETDTREEMVDAGDSETPMLAAAEGGGDAPAAAIAAPVPDFVPAADTPDGPPPREDAVVRLVNQDGKGRPVDVAVSRTPAEQAKDTGRSPEPLRIETATVLDARRYLGFTPDTNATALANAVRSDPSWSAALQAAQRADIGSLASTATAVNTLKLQMNPENLGNMVASLKLRGEELTVEVRVDSIEAYRHLSADHDDIVKALQDQGFSIDKVTVQLNATDRADMGNDRDTARQGGQGQRDGAGGQAGRNDNRQEGQRPQWLPSGQALQESAAADGGAGAGRGGNIYL